MFLYALLSTDSDFSKEHSGFDDPSLSKAPFSGSPSISATLNPGGFKDNPKQVLLEGSALILFQRLQSHYCPESS